MTVLDAFEYFFHSKLGEKVNFGVIGTGLFANWDGASSEWEWVCLLAPSKEGKKNPAEFEVIKTMIFQ